MPKFYYVVKDKNGKTYKDVRESANQSSLITQFQNEGYFIVSIKHISSDVSQKQLKSTQKTKKEKEFTHKKIKLQDVLIFARQLTVMLEAGVTLVRSLNVIQTQIKSQQLSEVLAQVKADVEKGTAFSAALAQHPKVFNQFWVSLMEVGEASGTIPTVLEKLAGYLEQQAAFRSTIISGVIYPLILFCVSMGAVAFFALFVGPRFEAIFDSMNVDLPLITRVLLSVFRFFKEKFFLILGGVGLVIFLFKKYIQTYNGRTNYEKFLLGFPVIGDVYTSILVERFTSQMSLLVDSGVPILYALDITERLVDNNVCAEVVSNIREGVRQGDFFAASMERSGFFPSLCLQMIMVGEETGELSKMFRHIAAFYQSAVKTFMERFATIIEPFMLVFMGAIIGTIVVAMFLPMFNLSQLGGG
ncbi:Type IV fimbrial assembly protein PilC [hydrothermal vent metagenome]|uniref:Type IV fimbrial assembly protein PilC n=1 Tax=hydrothermal vent metagenome TaxID=652676 RepID=A0A3B1DSM1_9ZZZZ